VVETFHARYYEPGTLKPFVFLQNDGTGPASYYYCWHPRTETGNANGMFLAFTMSELEAYYFWINFIAGAVGAEAITRRLIAHEHYNQPAMVVAGPAAAAYQIPVFSLLRQFFAMKLIRVRLNGSFEDRVYINLDTQPKLNISHFAIPSIKILLSYRLPGAKNGQLTAARVSGFFSRLTGRILICSILLNMERFPLSSNFKVETAGSYPVLRLPNRG